MRAVSDLGVATCSTHTHSVGLRRRQLLNMLTRLLAGFGTWCHCGYLLKYYLLLLVPVTNVKEGCGEISYNTTAVVAAYFVYHAPQAMIWIQQQCAVCSVPGVCTQPVARAIGVCITQAACKYKFRGSFRSHKGTSVRVKSNTTILVKV